MLRTLKKDGYIENHEVFGLKKDGTPFWLNCTIKGFNELGYMEGVAIDTTERKIIEKERAEHLKYLQNMETIDGVMRQADNLEEMLNKVLDSLLSIFNCDRAWLLYPCDPESLTWSVHVERINSNWPGESSSNGDHSMSPELASEFKDLLAAKKPVKYDPDSKNFLNKKLDEKFLIKSKMSMAICPKLKKPWVLDVHQCSWARIWTEEEERLFNEIGNRLADGLNSFLIMRDLRSSEERFRRLAENAKDMIYCITIPDGKFEYISPASEQILGYSQEEILKQDKLIEHIIHPDWQDYYVGHWNNLIKGKILPAYEYKIIHKSGEERWLYERKVLIKNDSGDIVSVEGIITDITERKKAEEMFTSVFYSNPIATTITRVEDGCIIKVNDSFLELTGFLREDIVKGKTNVLNMWADFDQRENIIKKIRENGFVQDAEMKIRNVSGEIVDCLFSSKKVKVVDTDYLFSMAINISARKKIEEKILV